MTTVEQIDLLYKQFDNLSNEIYELIDTEDYDSALEKVRDKDKLIKKIAIAMKTAELSAEEKALYETKNREISKKNFELIEELQQIHKELATQRTGMQKKIKLQNAYSQNINPDNSFYVDMEE